MFIKILNWLKAKPKHSRINDILDVVEGAV